VSLEYEDIEDESSSKNSKFSHYLDFDGRRQSISKWALEKGIAVPELYQRIRMGWSTEKALTTPESAERALSVPVSTTVEVKKTHSTSLTRHPNGRRGPPEKLYKFRGERLTLTELAVKGAPGLTADTLRNRLKYGWSLERSLEEPVHVKSALRAKQVSRRISHPDYIPSERREETSLVSVVDASPHEIQDGREVAPLSSEIQLLEKRLVAADKAVEREPEDEVPAFIQELRERFWRLDEIDYEIALLRDERKRIHRSIEEQSARLYQGDRTDDNNVR